MKKLINIFVILVLIVFAATPVYATTTGTLNTKISEATKMADELKKLGLFSGTDKGYELERTGTRTESIAMLVRLLGEQNVANTSNYHHPFTDVPNWANKTIAYAYNKKYTAGVSKTMFGANEKTTAAQYITFVLRALGYSEKTDGYTWNNPFVFAQEVGLIKNGEYSSKSSFVRADMVIISYRALDIKYKNQSITLREKLAETEDFDNTQGTGDTRDAGVFNTSDDKLVTVNKSVEYRTNLDKLNGMLMKTYGITYAPEMTTDGVNSVGLELKYDDTNNRYGLKVSGWRHSYDSGSHINALLNAVLETLYFECGDKEVAYALWSWIDAKNINGRANTDDFGFKDTATLENGFSAIMNGVEVDITKVNGSTIIFFK